MANPFCACSGCRCRIESRPEASERLPGPRQSRAVARGTIAQGFRERQTPDRHVSCVFGVTSAAVCDHLQAVAKRSRGKAMRRSILANGAALILVVAAIAACQSAAPTPSPSPTPAPTATPSPTPLPTPSPTPTATPTASPTINPNATPTPVPTGAPGAYATVQNYENALIAGDFATAWAMLGAGTKAIGAHRLPSSSRTGPRSWQLRACITHWSSTPPTRCR